MDDHHRAGELAALTVVIHKAIADIAVITRNKKIKLKKKNIAALDAMYQTFLGWCDRIGIEPVRL